VHITDQRSPQVLILLRCKCSVPVLSVRVSSHSCRNDSQASDCILPLITRELLPRSPGLANAHSINGPVVYFRILAYPLRMKHALKWAEDNQVSVGRKPHMRRKLVLPAILCRLPHDCRRIAAVPLGGGAAAFSVVVATNNTAEDLEMIQNVQRDMGSSLPQAWYISQKSWCVSLFISAPPCLIL
jgi:hypothetical protein